MSLAIGIMNRIDNENSAPSITRCQGVTFPYQMIVRNINSDTFANGEVIPLITDQAAWNAAGIAGTPARWFYNNDPANGDIYGQLYNEAAVRLGNQSTRNGWPGYLYNEGWRALRQNAGSTASPSLGSFASGIGQPAGAVLKAIGTTYWSAPNTGANNFTGFTALPGGQRTDTTFENITTNAYFWCLPFGGLTRAVSLDYNQTSLDSITSAPVNYGMSIRVGKLC